ncbi:hypothetical protein E2C01_049463 [Portunus trituberculatus]|uniref:Uncharacterized protein n=1 Tax=Portunus trituberculatus TaxID=210409 RepID=A0A5B7GE10_PORTR|nr:hypothetical protein [Portunus trituberculatus]
MLDAVQKYSRTTIYSQPHGQAKTNLTVPVTSQNPSIVSEIGHQLCLNCMQVLLESSLKFMLQVLVVVKREAQWVYHQLQEEFGSDNVALLSRLPEYDRVLHL